MFRAAYPSSSGAPNCICSLWFIYPCSDRPYSRLSLDNGRSPHVYTNQRLQIQFRAPDDEQYAPSINFGIINFITRLHLFGYFCECTEVFCLLKAAITLSCSVNSYTTFGVEHEEQRRWCLKSFPEIEI